MNYDRELLRRFYMKNGYADFRVVSSVAELTPDRSRFFLTFTLEEGERYNMGDVLVNELNSRSEDRGFDAAGHLAKG